MAATGWFEKKAADSVWGFVGKWLNRNRDLKKQVATLTQELADERSGQRAFEQLLTELECRPEDDNLYWKKDGQGGPYCPLCLHNDTKLIPLTHGIQEGSFYCGLHEQTFETAECRARFKQMIRTRNRAYASQRHRSSWVFRY